MKVVLCAPNKNWWQIQALDVQISQMIEFDPSVRQVERHERHPIKEQQD
jgi:hypothetical protein